MKTIKTILIGMALALSGLTTPVLAGDKDPLFIGLSSDAVPRISHVLHFAGQQLVRGHPLTIWLNEKGILLASKKHSAQLGEQQKLLAELIHKGAAVLVCGYCMKQFDVVESDLIAGAQPGSPALVGDALFRDDSKTLAW